MELLARTYLHLAWQYQSFRKMFVSVPLQTVLGVGAQVVAWFAQLFAFFLPLKVLIMLSSNHVPGKLQSFITMQNRTSWIAGFTIATFVLYALSVFMTTVTNRAISAGVDQLVRSTHGINRNEKRRLRKSYTMYCYAACDATVFLLGSLGLAFVNPLVLVGMMLVVLAEIILTGAILNSTFGGLIGWIRGGIGRNLKAYIQYLSAANFLALFLLIIADYFLRGKLNVYVALLTMILGRQTFANLTKFVRKMLAFGGDEPEEEEA